MADALPAEFSALNVEAGAEIKAEADGDDVDDGNTINTHNDGDEAVSAAAAELIKQENLRRLEEQHKNSFYEEVDLDDMELNEDTGEYSYPCPCGDNFVIQLEDLCNGEEVAYCPSCTLKIKVLYDPEDFLSSDEDEDDTDGIKS